MKQKGLFDELSSYLSDAFFFKKTIYSKLIFILIKIVFNLFLVNGKI